MIPRRFIQFILFIGALGILQGSASAAQVAPKAPALKDSNFQGAGVLPTYDFKGETYVILARENGGNDQGTWDSFGGSKDQGEDHPQTTATREFDEETKGLLEDFIDLDDKSTEIIVRTRHGGSSFVLYIAPLSSKFCMKTFGHKFHNKKTFGKYNEKDCLAAVKLSDFKKTISTAQRDQKTHQFEHIAMTARVYNPSNSGFFQNQTITLRPPLVWSLQPYFQGKTGIQGKDTRASFY
ncbi:MAG: NUDIX hydrolase [Candidatus Dependentiae bacterium]|nr:NUDIX hydrolase [Candidatus Dependentiae bacterium]